MAYVTQQLGTSADDKEAAIFKTLTKREWTAGLGKFENFLESDALAGFPKEIDFVKDAGAGVWMVGQRCNCFRFGPEAFPMPGFACLILAGK